MDYGLAASARPTRHHASSTPSGALDRAGLLGVDRYMGMAGTAHALGSLVTGSVAETSSACADGKVTAWKVSMSATAASCRDRRASTRP